MLAAALRLLVASSSRSMRSAARWKRLTRRPEQVVEIGLEPGVAEHRDEGFEDVGEASATDVPLRAAAADRARPGRGDSRRAAARRTWAVGEEVRLVRRFEVAGRRGRASWRAPSSDRPRPSRPSWRSPAGGRTGLHRGASGGPERSGGWREAGYFASRCKGGLCAAAAENSRRAAIARPGRLPADRPLRRPGAGLSDRPEAPCDPVRWHAETLRCIPSGCSVTAHRSAQHLPGRADARSRPKRVGAETAQIGVEVVRARRQDDRLDAGLVARVR